MAIDSAIRIISRWGSVAERKIFVFDGYRKEIDQYLEAIDEVQKWLKSAAVPDDRSKAESVMNIAMRRLADEFRNLLNVNARSNSTLNPNSSTYSSTMTDSASNNYEVYEDDYANYNTMRLEVIYDLRSIAVRMNSAGCLRDCVKEYIHERKSLMKVRFEGFNLRKLSSSSVRRLEWGDLESKIKAWIKCAKISFNYLFANEKRLSEQIFQGLGDETVDACFMETVKDSAIQLLDTAEALSCLSPTSEKLFKILDLYEILLGLLPQINKLFHTELSEYIRRKAVQILPKLVDASGKSLLEFENALLNEQSPVVPSESIHRLPKYVISYLYRLDDHKQILMAFSLSKPPSTGMSLEALELEGKSQLSLHVIWIIMGLVSNLESKAKKFKDASASHFFFMNNVSYVVQKIKARQELVELVEDEYINKLTVKFDQAKADYLRLTFESVLHFLRDEGLDRRKIFPFRDSKLTDRLKSFNAEFEKLHRDLAKLVVPDFQLVVDLRKSIIERLVSSYANFLGHIKNVPRLEPYVKYSAESLETAILDFFGGTPNH